ncbi:hypothetical protein EZV62_006227 [Acer yangbiense]|uniref:Uncharacterized protein n=1 Tax=Acer yangbiense TaxID=1000413 RepID=A0A5C7ISE9_9ROSI|nr:hypothetical protein EZV62_006227 [Acer yangbiense]
MYLLEWAWHLRENKQEAELVDSRLPEFNEEEVKRMIGVALLCTQTLPSLRPLMSRVVAMLCGDMEVSPVITKPGYFTGWKYDDTTTTGSFTSGTDKATIGTEYNSNFTSSSTTVVADAQRSPENVTKPILHVIIGDDRASMAPQESTARRPGPVHVYALGPCTFYRKCHRRAAADEDEVERIVAERHHVPLSFDHQRLGLLLRDPDRVVNSDLLQSEDVLAVWSLYAWRLRVRREVAIGDQILEDRRVEADGADPLLGDVRISRAVDLRRSRSDDVVSGHRRRWIKTWSGACCCNFSGVEDELVDRIAKRKDDDKGWFLGELLVDVFVVLFWVLLGVFRNLMMIKMGSSSPPLQVLVMISAFLYWVWIFGFVHVAQAQNNNQSQATTDPNEGMYVCMHAC